MATAQVLIVALKPADISADAFQAAVRAAAAAQGIPLGPWTYDATRVTVHQASDSHLVGIVAGGAWDGASFTFGAPIPSTTTLVISSFRQNMSVPDGADTSAIMTPFAAAVRSSLGLATSVDTTSVIGLKTLRRAISWDRNVPAPIALSAGGGSGAGIGLALLGLLAVGGIVFGRGTAKRASIPPRRRALRVRYA